MARMVHSMIRVMDEARSRAFYEQAFGLELVERVEFEGFTLVYLANGDASFELELTINHDRQEPYNLGDGYGHLAVTVEDLEAEHVRMLWAGLEPRKIVDFGNGAGFRAKFFFIADPDGYQIEVISRGGRFS